MDFIDKLYDALEEDLATLTEKDKTKLREIDPDDVTNEFEKAIIELHNDELYELFEKYNTIRHAKTSYMEKKYYLNGLRDGAKLAEFTNQK